MKPSRQQRLARAKFALGQSAMALSPPLWRARFARAALPGPLARRDGAVVNVSSIASFLYAAGSVNYCATKAYLTTFSEGLGAELAGTGVQVQALCPGFTRTEFHQRIGPAAGDHPAWMWLTADAVVGASLAQLDRRLTALEALDYPLVSVTVVDDGSIDDTAARVRR